MLALERQVPAETDKVVLMGEKCTEGERSRTREWD